MPICISLNFECFRGRSTAIRSFPRENWLQAIYRFITVWFDNFIFPDWRPAAETKTCPVDFCPVANACARSGHQLFASASDCQVKRSLEFLHFIRPVFLERFVEFYWASGITYSEELWRERSSVASFASALPCFWSSLRRPPSAKREVLGLFQDPFPAVHLPSTAFWTHLWLDNQNATKETTKGFFAGPGPRGHRTAWFWRAFLVLLLLIPE